MRSTIHRLVSSVLAVLLCCLSACIGDEHARVVERLEVVSGNQQTETQAQQLALPLLVRALDEFGDPMPSVSVLFVASDGGTITPQNAITDSSGLAAASWKLGISVGMQSVTVLVEGTAISAMFYATAERAAPGSPATFALVSPPIPSADQYSKVELPVLVADVLRNEVPDAEVQYTISSGEKQRVVARRTDSSGIARCDCYIEFAGTVFVRIDVTGILEPQSVEISIAPVGLFDGIYVLRDSGASGPEITGFEIVGSVVTPISTCDGYHCSVESGTVNAATGDIVFYASYSSYFGYISDTYQGKLSVTPDWDSTGAGTGTSTSCDAFSDPECSTFPWTWTADRN